MALVQLLIGLHMVLIATFFAAGPWSCLVQLRQSVLGQHGCAPATSLGKNVTLHYFAGRGRGEVIRLILNEAQIPYDETRFTKDTWPAAKEAGLKSGLYSFGQVPVLVAESGEKIVQTLAILKRIARASNMDCDCADLTLCETIILGTEDLTKHFGQVVYDVEFTAEKRLEYLKGKGLMWLEYLEKFHPGTNKDGHGFFVGNHLTWVDFAVFSIVDAHVAFATEVDGLEKVDIFGDKLPKLRSFHQGFSKRSRIAQYLAGDRRPKYTIPYPPK
eukprot:m.307140 g.307140  ORF g.307140 m.307140 type:complete len:273 (+) comp41947_c0_seq1:297-1115(+)